MWGLLAQLKMQTSGIRLKIIRLWDVFDGLDVFVCGLYFLYVRLRDCVYVILLFPGQENHVLYIGIIKFKRHKPRPPSVSHRTYS